MNKMNIPPPFRMALPTPPLPPEVPAPPLPPPHSVTAMPQSADMSSDESEMGSSDEVTSSLLDRDQTEPLFFLDLLYGSLIFLNCYMTLCFVFHPAIYFMTYSLL